MGWHELFHAGEDARPGGGNTPDEPADWRSNWTRTDIPPSLVKLNVQFQDGRRWRPLVVELKLD